MRTVSACAAVVAAVGLSACGGGGGGGGGSGSTPAPTSPAEALRWTAQAVVDLTEGVWQQGFELQNSVVTASLFNPGTFACSEGGSVTRRWARPLGDPAGGLLEQTFNACGALGVVQNGRLDVTVQTAEPVADGTAWRGSLRYTDWRLTGPRETLTRQGELSGQGAVFRSVSAGQPMAMALNNQAFRQSADALGRNTLFTSPALTVQREVAAPTRDLYAISGCTSLRADATATAPALVGELCIDAGSRIALLENVGSEQLTGRIRWNAGSPGGFEAALRVTPSGATALRIELDLDNNGSFEASTTLDRSNDIGLRL